MTIEDERGCSRRFRDLRHPVAQKDHEDQKDRPGREGRQPPAPAGFHVDHALPDHRAARHPADEARGRVGDALPDAFLVAVGFRVGQVIDQSLRHQAFQQTHDGDSKRIGEDDLQGFKVQRNVGDQEDRQGIGQFAHVAHGADIPAEGQRQGGKDDDRDQRRGDRLGDIGEEIDDREPRRDEGIGQPGDLSGVKLGQLRHEDQDRQRVDKAGHHRFRHVAHDEA
jgi:hypothetical protein